MNKLINKLWMLMVLLALLVSPVAAGVVYEIEVTDHEQSPPKSEAIEMRVEERNLKMGIASGSRGSKGEMIYHGNRHEMVVVDHDDKSYMVIDKATIAMLGGQVNQAMSQMQEALKNVPEDQRAMVEKMMKERGMPQQQGQLKRSKSNIRRTSERANQSGYPCVKYEVLRDGRKISEMWITDWDNLEGGNEAADAFKDMADFFSEFRDKMQINAGGQATDDNVFVEYLDELDGFPVKTNEFDGGSLESESTLQSAQRRTLDPAEFEPPSGYKRKSMGP